MKTNIGLVQWAMTALAQGWAYWYGTVCQKCSSDLYTRKKAQYPEHYTSDRTQKYMSHIAAGKMCADCINLIKGYMWTRDDGTRGYGINGCPDKSADGMFSLATKKGSISSIPEIPGLIVRFPGHAGVYIGGGYVIEARGFNFGVVKTKLTERGWTHWYMMPGITYVDAKEAEVLNTYIVRGNTGEKVVELQKALMKAGYALPKYGSDGDFGEETYTALVKFQADHGLHATGMADEATLKALENVEPNTVITDMIIFTRDLKAGCVGEDVRRLQHTLNTLGAMPILEEDGEFGKNTFDAVTAFQTRCGLKADGIVGTNTVKAINSKIDGTTNYIVVTGNTVNVRTGAGTNNAIIGIAKKGECYELIQESNGWMCVKYKNTTGWISGSFTKAEAQKI